MKSAASEIDFNEIDTLDFAYLQSVEGAARMPSSALRDADAVMAHYSVAELVIEVASREHRALPVMERRKSYETA